MYGPQQVASEGPPQGQPVGAEDFLDMDARWAGLTSEHYPPNGALAPGAKLHQMKK